MEAPARYRKVHRVSKLAVLRGDATPSNKRLSAFHGAPSEVLLSTVCRRTGHFSLSFCPLVIGTQPELNAATDSEWPTGMERAALIHASSWLERVMQHIALLMVSLLAAMFLVKYFKAIIALIVILLLALAIYGLLILLTQFSGP